MIYGNKFLPKEVLTESKLNGVDYTVYDVKEKYKTDKKFIEENIGDINHSNIYKTNGEILVDNSNGKVIGSVLVKDYSDGKWIGSLNVKPKYRQKGFGTLLLKDAVNKYKGVFLGVRKNNTVALEMYKKNGFEITSHVEVVLSLPDIVQLVHFQRRVFPPVLQLGINPGIGLILNDDDGAKFQVNTGSLAGADQAV